jgi:hypothetical protein
MADTETTDLIRLLRLFGVRALALTAVAALVGFTTVALALGLAACALLFAPVGRRGVTSADAPATPEPPDWPAPGRGPRGGSPG